jgi:hypothetical protein
MSTTLDLRASSVSIKFDKGKTFEPTFYYVSPQGTVIDLTNYKARMQVRATAESADKLWDLTTENNGITIVQGTAVLADGSLLPNAYGLKLSVSAADTAAVAWAEAVYDIELVTADNKVLPFLKGSISGDNEVTR